MIELGLLFAVAFQQADPSPASPTLDLLAEESVIAIVTHKGGFAGGLAHNHVVAATNYAANLSFDPARPLEASFEVDLFAEDLIVDDDEVRRRWYPRLEATAVLNESFRDISDNDREKIRREMLKDGQLDAESFPTISARLLSVEPGDTVLGNVPFDYRATVELTVHGTAVQRSVAARFSEEDGGLTIEAVGEFGFEDFGIEPYSAFLGSVKNRNEFHVYLSLRASLGRISDGPVGATPSGDRDAT